MSSVEEKHAVVVAGEAGVHRLLATQQSKEGSERFHHESIWSSAREATPVRRQSTYLIRLPADVVLKVEPQAGECIERSGHLGHLEMVGGEGCRQTSACEVRQRPADGYCSRSG